MTRRRIGVVVGLLLMLTALATVSGCGVNLKQQMGYQGYLTDTGGNPITGNRAITFRLFTAASGGIAVWTESHASVFVSSGLFDVALGSVTPLDEAQFHQPLYLEVEVGGEALPRQPLLGSPYAFSLVPGAAIKGTINTSETYSSTLTVVNWGTGQGMAVLSQSGPALVARSASNAAIMADGKISSTAPTYVWITGNSLVRNESTDTTRWDCQPNGGALVYRGSATGNKIVYFNVTVPAVMYGETAKITKITVFYKCPVPANAYISGTSAYRFADADSYTTIVSNGDDRASTSASSYSINLTSNNELSANTGGLGIFLNLAFLDNVNYVQIGGIRLDLEYR